MLSSVVKYGAVELEEECISLSESNVQTSAHFSDTPYRPSDTRRVFNSIPSPQKAHDDKSDVVIIEEEPMAEKAQAKPYVFPTLDEKELEYTEHSDGEAQQENTFEDDYIAAPIENYEQKPFEEPFDNGPRTMQPQGEIRSLYDDIVAKSVAEASRILEEAHAKAQADYYQLMEKGKAEIEQAKNDGLQQGITEGARSQVANIKACIEQLEHSVARIEGKQEEYFASCEQDVKWLSLEIAQKVLNQKLSEDELALYPLVTAAVAKQKNAQWLTVEISDNAPELLKRLKAELEKADEGKNISISGVEATAGTCRMQTPDGFIDASIYRQLDNLRDYFAQQPQ